MHFVTAGGQLENVVESGAGDHIHACTEAQNRNNLHGSAAILPQRRLAQSPTRNRLVVRRVG